MQDDSNNRWVELVSKLIALTQDGVLKWNKTDYQGGSGFFQFKFEKYIVPYKKKKIILSVFPLSVPGKQYKLEIASDDEVPLFEIPITSGIKDLHDAVKYSASGVKQFIDDLLAED